MGEAKRRKAVLGDHYGESSIVEVLEVINGSDITSVDDLPKWIEGAVNTPFEDASRCIVKIMFEGKTHFGIAYPVIAYGGFDSVFVTQGRLPNEKKIKIAVNRALLEYADVLIRQDVSKFNTKNLLGVG